jgi:hypothetical protein
MAGHDIVWAVKQMLKGLKIRELDWQPNSHAFIKDGEVYYHACNGKMEKSSITIENILSNNWVLAEA